MYKKLPSCEFCENWCSDSHTSVWAVGEFLLSFLHFVTDLSTIRCTICYVHATAVRTRRTAVRACGMFCPHFHNFRPIWIMFGTSLLSARTATLVSDECYEIGEMDVAPD